MTILYIQTPGATVRLRNELLEVYGPDDLLLDKLRLREVEGLVIMSGVHLTTPVLATLLDRGIDTAFLTGSGRYRGRLATADGKNVFLRQGQFRRLEDLPFRLTTAIAMIAAKIRHARLLLQRNARNHPQLELTREIELLARMQAGVQQAKSLDSLRGLEGDAARCYFSAYVHVLRSPEMIMHGRTRRPPKDPVNAMLSFGYALLMTEALTAVSASGLDPAVGILHELNYGRPSLALDLMEEFRPLLVDRLVARLINRGQMTPLHFVPHEPDGIYLNETGRQILLPAFHAVMTDSFNDRSSDTRVNMRQLLQRQAQRLKKALSGEEEPYLPVEFR